MRGELTYPLNPTDYVLLAMHESLQRRGYCGLNVMLIAELEGDLDPQELAHAVRALGHTYPALSAHLTLDFLGRPRWRITEDARLEDAVEYLPTSTNGADNDGWAAFDETIDAPVNLRAGPQLRLVHVQLGGNRHRLGLRWAHPLMDFEGGHLLLRCLHELLTGQSPSLDPDPRAIHPPPYDPSFPLSVWRTWCGQYLFRRVERIRQPRIVRRPEGATQRCRVIVRTYDPPRRARFEAAAKGRTSEGPLRYSRDFLISLARTYRAMATERGRPQALYAFPLPLPLPRPGQRPGVHGNYVTIPWFVFETDDLADRRRADAACARQFEKLARKPIQEANWMMYRTASTWPLRWTRWFIDHRKPRGAAGYTGYQFDDSFTRLGDARIVNLTGSGPIDCHPGWLVGRCSYAGNLSVSVTYFEDHIDTPSVHEFLDRLERELFEE